jgi:hypothetical protein
MISVEHVARMGRYWIIQISGFETRSEDRLRDLDIEEDEIRTNLKGMVFKDTVTWRLKAGILEPEPDVRWSAKFPFPLQGIAAI